MKKTLNFLSKSIFSLLIISFMLSCDKDTPNAQNSSIISNNSTVGESSRQVAGSNYPIANTTDIMVAQVKVNGQFFLEPVMLLGSGRFAKYISMWNGAISKQCFLATPKKTCSAVQTIPGSARFVSTKYTNSTMTTTALYIEKPAFDALLQDLANASPYLPSCSGSAGDKLCESTNLYLSYATFKNESVIIKKFYNWMWY